MLVRRKASHSPRSSVKMRGDSPDNGELASLYRINDSSRHSSIAFRPAAVIWRRTTSTGLAPAFMVSHSAVASPARTRPATMSLSNPWARTSSASVAPCGLLASSLSSSSVRRGCGLRRRFRMVVIRPLSDARYVLSIDRRAVGLLGHAGPESHPRPPALCERKRSKNGGPRGALSGIPRKSPSLTAAARSEFVADGQLGRRLGK
jgi:hypothetical protein